MSKLDQDLYHWVGGQLVERDALRIAEKVAEYDPSLKIQYLEEAANSIVSDPPFRIVELCPDGIERTVFYAWQLDDRIIERLYAADNRKHNVLAELDKNNAKAKKEVKRNFEEKLIDAHDISAAVARTPKDTYSAKDPFTGRKITFKSNEPAKVEKP